MCSLSIPVQGLEVWYKQLVYNIFFPSSDTIKTFYSDRQQWEELKMTSFIVNPLVHSLPFS